ncbi:MAG TPA: phosphoenolpyruvate--protein phosphotransferase [Verrucomicrobiae bacterium]|nr:phosphoenolpyruvate--protein phosphotransferase [Verrucomicrobiae bacterium]
MTDRSTHFEEFVFSCPLPSGLHARPASQLAEVANQFEAGLTLTNLRNGLSANAKSVLGIIAADIRFKDRCALRVTGRDEDAARAALRRFLEDTLSGCDVPLADIAAPVGRGAIPRALLAAKTNCLSGVPVSRGIAQGKVVPLKRMALPNKVGSASGGDPLRELDRIKEAISAVRQRIGEKLKYSVTPVGVAVLQADLAMASDVLLVEKLAEEVSRGRSAEVAVIHAGEFFIDLLGHSENEYIRQRSADIEEICLQLLEEIGGTNPAPVPQLDGPSIVTAEALAPQQLLQINRGWLRGLLLEQSGATSHAAILARSLGIPTVAGIRNARVALTPGREILIDANRGLVFPDLSPPVVRFYEREQKTLERRVPGSPMSAGRLALNGKHPAMEVGANVSSGEEAILAFENGSDGIGLFRTEMTFLSREEAPTEEEQFAIYSEVTRRANGRPVIIRTFDVGGDKRVPYLNLPQEENPFLGYRGARIYAEYPELLQSQLRAILRASALGPVQVMAPMITSFEEVISFKAAVTRAKQHLADHGVSFQADIKIGIMVEVPSVVLILDELCAEVDFFSIGTNDLSQYFLAADRSNPKITSLFTVRHPGFLRLLVQLVESVRAHKKWIGMCGEMAGDLRNLPLLIGLGLDEISVPAAEVDHCKRYISTLRTQDCTEILRNAVACQTSAAVEELLAARSFRTREPLLTRELVLLESTSQTKEEVIQEMVDAFYVSDRTQDRQRLEEALWAREAVYSTGLGFGFATPHCKTDAITADSICVLRLRNPINWDSVDGEQVRMVVLLALRDSGVTNTHMQVFSTLARRLMNEDFRQHLLKVETPAAATMYLAKQLGVLAADDGENLEASSSTQPLRS